MKIKIALFKYGRWPDWAPVVHGPDRETDTTYYRISEYVEVEFPDLADTDSRAQRLACLKRDRAQLEAIRDKKLTEYTEDAARLDKRIAELSASAGEERESEPA
jgi:hypothetical protein